MKNFLSIITLSLCIIIGASAQSTSPRWGSGPPTNDNTGRVLTYASSRPAYATTLALKPNAWETTVRMDSLTGNLTVTATVTKAYFGDKLNMLFLGDVTGARVVTFSTGMAANAGTLTVDALQKAGIYFIFDGVSWVEVGRAKQ